MTNNKNIAKCPTCGIPARQTEISEVCMLVNGTEPCFESLLASCIKPAALKKFNASGLGADPCEHCQHNQITEIPGTFVTMQQSSANSWQEIHLCSACQTKYTVDSVDR